MIPVPVLSGRETCGGRYPISLPHTCGGLKLPPGAVEDAVDRAVLRPPERNRGIRRPPGLSNGFLHKGVIGMQLAYLGHVGHRFRISLRPQVLPNDRVCP